MSGTKTPPQVPESIDLFGDDDEERTEIAPPNFSAALEKPVKVPEGISLEDDDDGERTQIEKKPPAHATNAADPGKGS